MCAVAGLFAYRKGSGKIDPSLLVPMRDTMIHRGPDDGSIYLSPDGRLALCSRRLSIIDLAGGRQPMSNEDGTLWVAFNGEIYNFRELRGELLRGGHLFKTVSDTEVILHLYEDKGLDFVKSLEGMYAIALWDGQSNRLVLARDPLGIKPLYYAQVAGEFLFSSEVKGLLRSGLIKADLDEQAAYAFFTLRCVPSPLTMFKGISKVSPGHILVVDGDGPRDQTPFWAPERPWSMPTAHDDEGETVSALRGLLSRSVESHLVSDVPVGAFLSGGIDSSVMVSLMSRLTSRRISTFTVGFPDPKYSEFAYAGRLARYLGTDHHEVTIDGKEFVSRLPEYLYHLDDPVADPSSIPVLCLSFLVRDSGTKVILTGEGSDELFAGYSTYLDSAWMMDTSLRAFEKLPKPGRGLIGALLGRFGAGSFRAEVLYRVARNMAPYLGEASVFEELEKKRLFRKELGDPRRLPMMFRADPSQAKEMPDSPVDTMLLFDLKTRVPDDLLARTDRMTMAASVEARVPYLDRKVVEFALGLPAHWKVRGNTTKYILRRVAEGLIPPELIHREKKGFPVPTRGLMEGELGPLMRRVLVEDGMCPDIFDREYIRRLWTMRQKLDPGGGKLWALFSFVLWHRYWIEGTEPSF